MFADQACRQTLTLAANFKLHEEGFAHIAGATTDGLEPHDELPRSFDNFFGPAALRGDLFIRRVQPAILVEISDNRLGRVAYFTFRAVHVKLPLKMVGQ